MDRPELIFSMGSLDADTRRLMSGSVQASLFKLGYGWTDGNPHEVKNTEREALRIFTPHWDAREISYADGPQSSDGPAMFFDANQVGEFLAYAERFMPDGGRRYDILALSQGKASQAPSLSAKR
jgi:hypothetical protein